MKIAFDISQIAYENTGVAEYTSELVKAILKKDQINEYVLFGYSMRQISTLKGYLEIVKRLNKNVTGKFFPYPQTIARFMWNKIHKINIERLIGKIDIFYSSDWICPPSTAKKITTIHDLVVFKYPQYSHPQIVQTQKQRLYWVKKEIDLIIADSHSTSEDITNILNIPQNKIEVVYPGIGSQYKKTDQEEIIRIKQKYDITGDYVLCVGTMEPRKNLKTVLLAFERFMHNSLISGSSKPVNLIIAGKKGWGEAIKPAKNIKIIGQVEKIDLPGLYSGANMFVYPSLYEGFGLPVIEAMACGCPVLTSNRGSLKEIVSDCALLVDPQGEEDIAIKMTKIFIDGEMRKQLIDKGLKNASLYSWDNTAGKMIDIFNNFTDLK